MSVTRKANVTKDEIALARSVDLLSYLRTCEPHELRRSGPNEYRTVSHGSLVISKDLWIWNRGGFGGKSALDYLIKIRKMTFVDAVQTICESYAVSSVPSHNYNVAERYQERSTKNWVFYPPKPIRYGNRAVSYLQARGIAVPI